MFVTFLSVCRGIITKSTVWDRLVFKKIQDTLGGRVKLIVTGAAPISPPVLRFLRLAFGAAVCEGYGQTECSAAMTVTLIGDQTVGQYFISSFLLYVENKSDETSECYHCEPNNKMYCTSLTIEQ